MYIYGAFAFCIFKRQPVESLFIEIHWSIVSTITTALHLGRKVHISGICDNFMRGSRYIWFKLWRRKRRCRWIFLVKNNNQLFQEMMCVQVMRFDSQHLYFWNWRRLFIAVNKRITGQTKRPKIDWCYRLSKKLSIDQHEVHIEE